MNAANSNTHTRDEEAEEHRQDDELELEISASLKRWARRAIWLGLALIASVSAVVPFLYGYPLHRHWHTAGKKILVLSMCLLPAFMFSAGQTFVLWWYLRKIKEIHQKHFDE